MTAHAYLSRQVAVSVDMALNGVNAPGTIVPSRKDPTLRGECGWPSHRARSRAKGWTTTGSGILTGLQSSLEGCRWKNACVKKAGVATLQAAEST